MRTFKHFKRVGTGVLAGMTISATMTTFASAQLPKLTSDPLCENEKASISIDHPTANIADCKVRSDARLAFTIRPENTPINNSAWYGFRVDPKEKGTLTVTLNYVHGDHRYRPKVSYDGKTWDLVPKDKVEKKNNNKFTMRLKLGKKPFYVSAQEILTKEAHLSWAKQMATKHKGRLLSLGKSNDGHPLGMLSIISEPDVKKPYVMWVGRQHPPEVTGALALMPFTEAVLADTKLAKQFRETFNILVVPNMNPDGVTDGYWRHNKGGVDLNRDWGPFTQPETQAVRNVLLGLKKNDDRLALFLDFHSTKRNLFYTQTDEEVTSPPMFAHNWLAAADERLPDKTYKFDREERAMSERAISKNYVYKEFGVAAITYEVGDRTKRPAIKKSATIFAQEMMRLLLEDEAARQADAGHEVSE